ncbi:hypothetical protein GCM10012275_63240 [Longimycelium tulufanense]|uniref:Uncharacterized protein n=1 Tax=Longimycelium tulufanense TaxID=907463 RepID=A0A8J3CLM2_9PSEU|nr:hypothetical protein [Longimycelium tulufanense]GGM83976.1 hypothetical protein GCM10012275_63240 [Longimycelium tulufanense]
MTPDASGSIDHVAVPGDPLCALLAAPSPEHSLELLPAAVRRAAELAERLRAAVRLRRRSTDPLLVELVAAMDSAAVAHERFVATWSDTTALSGFTQEMLEADVCTLTDTWASVIGVVVDAQDTA